MEGSKQDQGRNKWNYFISPHFPRNRDVGKSSQWKIWGKHQEPFLHHIFPWEAAHAGPGSHWHPPDPIQGPAALLTLWTCGPSAPQNDRSHSSDAGHFLIWGHNDYRTHQFKFSQPYVLSHIAQWGISVLFSTHCPCSSFKERPNCNWHFLLNFKKQEQFPLHASVWGCPWQ